MPYDSKLADTAAEVTVVISILRDPPNVAGNQHGTAHATHVHYTILLWLVGKVLMPPYLPRFSASVPSRRRDHLLKRLNELDNQFESRLNTDLGDRDWDDVTDVGEQIAKYIPNLEGCLQVLPKLKARNVIIHTDEPTIPWHLAYSNFGGEYDFLCRHYTCGTVLVAETPEELMDAAEAMARVVKHKNSEPPEYDELRNRTLCLIAGEIGVADRNGDDLGLAYVNKLKRRLKTKCPMNIECIQATDWVKSRKNPIDELNAIFARAQIVHFTGHFVGGKMQFAKNLLVGGSDLLRLNDLTSKQLVVLHGCASAGSAGIDAGEVFRMFLNKRASGCLATVFPVNIPQVLSDKPETLTDFFYEKLFAAPSKSYGSILQASRVAFWMMGEAGQAHRPANPSFHDPQPLFYHFFGDPRETLIATRKKNITHFIAQFDGKTDDPSPPQATKFIFSFPSEGVNEKELTLALQSMEGIQNITIQPVMVPLGIDPHLLTVAGELVLFAVASQSIEEKIRSIEEKIMQRLVNSGFSKVPKVLLRIL